MNEQIKKEIFEKVKIYSLNPVYCVLAIFRFD